jgi:hypothetical protein
MGLSLYNCLVVTVLFSLHHLAGRALERQISVAVCRRIRLAILRLCIIVNAVGANDGLLSPLLTNENCKLLAILLYLGRLGEDRRVRSENGFTDPTLMISRLLRWATPLSPSASTADQGQSREKPVPSHPFHQHCLSTRFLVFIPPLTSRQPIFLPFPADCPVRRLPPRAPRPV